MDNTDICVLSRPVSNLRGALDPFVALPPPPQHFYTKTAIFELIDKLGKNTVRVKFVYFCNHGRQGHLPSPLEYFNFVFPSIIDKKFNYEMYATINIHLFFKIISPPSPHPKKKCLGRSWFDLLLK